MGRIKLTIVLMLIYAVKCFAMSHNELEDFAEYLSKTSQLTPSLKQGTSDFDENDEDELVSDHAWELSGKFEGDLILNERQRRLIVQNVAEQSLARNGIIDAAKRWPNNEVIYAIQVEHFSKDQLQAIQDGIDDLARASCIKFRRYRHGDRDAVVILGNRKGCFSQVGYQGGFQALNLNSRHPVGRGCFRHGTVVHELLHTLGFYHMQSSPDRDDYVDIIWDNIKKALRHNFRKYNTFTVTDFGVGYDYDSVLHYSRNAFTVNGKATIVPKQRGAQIGQRVGLSDKDTQKLNKMYCDADSDSVQSVEDTTEKSKKKSFKNKPFEGHGLGYHKGTAVVFKLLPEAETYKLADVPSSHVFDYFSKQPQILSTAETEDFRTGKKIRYSYNTPEPLITIEYKGPANFYKELEKLHNKGVNKQIQHLTPETMEMNHANVEKSSKVINEADLPAEPLKDTHNFEENPELIDAFDRLSKIIKSHVYPSQTPDLSIYKMNEPQAKLKNNGEVEKRNDYPTFKYIRNPGWEGEKASHDFIPVISPNGLYEIKPAENSNKNVAFLVPDYKAKYEKYVDHSYQRYPEEEEYEKQSSIIHNGKKSHSDLEWSPSYTPYRDSTAKYREQYLGFSKVSNFANNDYKDHDIVKTYF